MRTFDVEVLAYPRSGGRMKLLALVTESKSVARYLRTIDEPSDVPRRSPSRGTPFWKSVVLLRREALCGVTHPKRYPACVTVRSGISRRWH
jgi:hypothetical protein